MQSLASPSLEFEVMVARAARRGWLDIQALSETYAQLEPTAHRELNNPRQVDTDAVVAALKMLPTEIVETGRLLFVPRLDAFPHEPVVTGAGLRAGQLGDGTLLIEAPLGAVSIADLAAALCVLYLEIEKADGLLPPELRRSDDAEDDDWDDDDGDGDDDDDDDDDDLAQPGTEELAIDPEPEREPPATFDGVDDLVVPAVGSDLDAPGAEPESDAPEGELGSADPGGHLTEDDLLATGFSHLAFAWGTDLETIRRANAETGGAFLQLLLRQVPLPEIDIHAELEPGAIFRRQQRIAERVVSVLAELGLIARPIHLWIGSGVISECLSPYPRELRDTLCQWADLQPQQLGEDLRRPLATPGEDVIYAITHDFLRANPELRDERAEADRTVGLLRHEIDGLRFESIDLARVDSSVCDARVADWDPGHGGPVLLRLPPGLGDPSAGLLRGVLAALGPSVNSITLVLEGSVFGGHPGAVVLPHLMVRWAGEQKLWLPTGSSLAEEDLQGYTDLPVRRGAVLSVPSAALVSANQIASLQHSVGLCAVAVGGAGLLSAIADALWSGVLPSDVRTSWGLVGVQRVASGRPTVPSLAGLSAIAIARLRALASPEPEPEPVRAPEPEPPVPRGPSTRAIRIRA